MSRTGILTNPFYAGKIQSKFTDGEIIDGKHRAHIVGGVPASTRDIKRKDGRLQGQSGNAPLSPQTTYPLRRRATRTPAKKQPQKQPLDVDANEDVDVNEDENEEVNKNSYDNENAPLGQ